MTTRSGLRAITALLLLWSADAQAGRRSFAVASPDGPVLVENVGGCTRPPCPAVIVLSGSKGFAAPAYKEIGRALQGAGLDPYLVHVLSPADLAAIAAANGAQARLGFYARRMADWTAAVHSVAAHLRAQPGHGDKVGLLGISLGAEIASAASVGQSDVGALVLVDGGFPTGSAPPSRPLPPLLLVWGEADRTFPLRVGRDLERSANGLGGSATLKVYEGGAHDFFLQTAHRTAGDAHRDAADFLNAHLSP